MSRIPVRYQHGYPVYEQTWNQAIFDHIDEHGLDSALATYSYEEVVHHIGGEMFGAKVTDDEVTIVKWFDNVNQLGYPDVEVAFDFLDALKYIRIGWALSQDFLVVYETQSREYHKHPLSKWSKVKTTSQQGNNNAKKKKSHKNEAELDADPDLTASEKTGIKNKLNDLGTSVAEEHEDDEHYWAFYNKLDELGFVEH